MQSEPLLSVILNIENSQENLNRSLGALFACKNERPVEVRAAVRAGKFAAPQILSVYQRSSALFSFTLCGEESPEQSVAKEIEKASGKYVLVADGGDVFSAVGLSELIDYLGTLSSDAVFFDTLENGRRTPAARAKNFTAEGRIETFLSQNARAVFPVSGAAIRKEFFLQSLPRSRALGFEETFAIAPLMFAETAYYARTTVLQIGEARAERDSVELLQKLTKKALGLADFFGEMRPLLSDEKYAFLFRYTRKKILNAYDAYVRAGGGQDEIAAFDEKLRDKNMPLYLSAGERSLLSYVEKLRKSGFALTKLQAFAVKLCLEVQDDFS